MRFHQLRNATCVIESGDQVLLIDPMLGKKGSLPLFARFRHKPQRNPLVPLPEIADELLPRVTACLLTHSQKLGIKPLQHTDHLDAAGEQFLRENRIPVLTGKRDVAALTSMGLTVHAGLEYWQPTAALGGTITAVPATHGHGWVHSLMANGVGFFLQLPSEPSIYFSGDTVYTEVVERVLAELKPDVAVMTSGGASLDVGGPILMPMEELMTFVRNAPGKVVANHLEALNHCPITRQQLSAELARNSLTEKVLIPQDGESLNLQA